jgi:hypothetical protein
MKVLDTDHKIFQSTAYALVVMLDDKPWHYPNETLLPPKCVVFIGTQIYDFCSLLAEQ